MIDPKTPGTTAGEETPGTTAPGESADARQAAGKLFGFVNGLHKSAVAALDVEDDNVRSGGQLL